MSSHLDHTIISLPPPPQPPPCPCPCLPARPTIDILDMKLKHAPCIGSAVFPPAIYFSISNPGSLSSTTPAECHPRLWIHTIKRGQGPGKANGSLRGASKKQTFAGEAYPSRLGTSNFRGGIAGEPNVHAGTCAVRLLGRATPACIFKNSCLDPRGKGGGGVPRSTSSTVANIRNFPMKDGVEELSSVLDSSS